MELYIEKEFLDKFDKNYNNEPIQKVVKEIFIGYGDKRVFVDYKEENFKKLNAENEIFALNTSNIGSLIPVNSIKEHLFSKSEFSQTIVFTSNEEDWFEDAREKGALCFSIKTYEKNIKDIIADFHFRIDLSSEVFKGWCLFSKMRELPSNELIFNDNYILSDGTNQKIDKNLYPFLTSIISKNSKKLSVLLFFKPGNRDDYKVTMKKAEKTHEDLVLRFKEYKNISFKIISKNNQPKIQLHDRYILSNFFSIESTPGFNLIPSKGSDGQVTVETIFNKYTYNRLRNLKKLCQDYNSKLNRLETVNFKSYPL
jgi:hypothetical protein